RTADRIRAGVTATLFTGLLVAAIVVGSRNLQNFDPALVIYTFATIFATWASSTTTACGSISLPRECIGNEAGSFSARRVSFAGWRGLCASRQHNLRPKPSFAGVQRCDGGCT